MNTIKPFPTRLDNDVRAYLEISSKNNIRSLNSEIAYRIKLTMRLEEIFQCSIDEIEFKINELKSAEKYKKLYQEANDKIKKYELTVNSALALANMDNEKAIRMKTEKALNFISEGLDELKNILTASNQEQISSNQTTKKG